MHANTQGFRLLEKWGRDLVRETCNTPAGFHDSFLLPMHVYVRACMYACLYACMHACMRACKYTRSMILCIKVWCMCIGPNAHAHARAHAHAHRTHTTRTHKHTHTQENHLPLSLAPLLSLATSKRATQHAGRGSPGAAGQRGQRGLERAANAFCSASTE